MRSKALSACILFSLSCAQIFAEDLSRVLEQRTSQYHADTVAVYYEAPDGAVFTYNPDVVMHAASTMKIPVLMEVFHQVEAGKLSLDRKVQVKNEFTSIMDGSLFALTKEEDSDRELYAHVGQEMPLRALLERMINSSSNLATNLIIQIVDPKNVMSLMGQLGVKDMNVLRGVEDIKAYDAGRNNTTSARALALCLKAILDPKLFHPDSRQQMFDILLSQKFKEIGKAVMKSNPDLKVASKDGYITEIHHDAAIIQDAKGKPTILVILTRGVKDDKAGEELVGVLAADVWTHFHH